MTRNHKGIRWRAYCGAVALLAFGLTVPPPLDAEITTFAVIGDYGSGSADQTAVAELINTWNPDFIATTGDNSYVSDYESTVGATYREYLDAGRFFPAIGNHDWDYPDAYFSFFDLPENRSYYDVVVGNVQLFMYDNNFEWGTTVDQAEQDEWLRDAMSSSTAEWKFLLAHQPRAADSIRANHVPDDIMLDEGGDAYFFAHNHYYQRNVLTDSIPSFTVGNGGSSLYPSLPGTDEPEAFHNDNYGALKVIIDGASAVFEFWSIANGGTLIDRYSLPEPATIRRPGDYNGDGLVDVVDIDLQALAAKESHPYISKFDENDDGLVNGIDREVWVHLHKQTYFGDADLNGEFGSADLVSVFVAGEYEDGRFGNSTWSTGDWDGDGDFTSSDLVLALADGNYEAGQRPAVVPEPSSLLLFALALAIGCSRTMRHSPICKRSEAAAES